MPADGARTTDDLAAIARHVEEIDPRIRAVVMPAGLRNRIRHLDLWARPALCVAMKKTGGRTLLPGRVLAPRSLMKSGEYRRLETAGFPVPRWILIEPHTVLDPADWGPYVVEKPNFGALGAHVLSKRTGRVKYRPPENLEDGHQGRRGGMIAQEFIYTGAWPQSFRVVTLLGKAILSYHYTTIGRGAALSGRWNHGKDGGPSIVSNTKDMRVTLSEDREIIALCQNAHRSAFPDIPLLGIDVVRDAETGRLHILEAHAHGPTWPFSSETALAIQQSNGVDFVGQFDGLRRCAGILAEATPRLAAMRWPSRPDSATWT